MLGLALLTQGIGRHRHGSPSVRVAPVAVPLTGSARVQVASSSPCGPDSSDPFAWPCTTRSPAGKPPAKPVAAQEVSRRQGFALVRSPEPGALRPAETKAGSRWPYRQLGQAIPPTATARRWLSFGNADGRTVFDDCPPSRPSQVARSSPIVWDASAIARPPDSAGQGTPPLPSTPLHRLRRLKH